MHRSPADGKAATVDAPADALPWSKLAERIAWRRAVLSKFNGSGRAVSVVCALMGLINAKRGYADPGNKYLARETGLRESHVQEALRALELGGAIKRVTRIINGRKQRYIYPLKTIFPTPRFPGSPTHPGFRGPGFRGPTKKRVTPLPASELEAAGRAARLRDGGDSARALLDDDHGGDR